MPFNIAFLENEIIDQYLHDENPERPWIIGLSGGKDYTLSKKRDVALIQDLLALQKTKTLMIKKRGLQADIERRIEQEINGSQQFEYA